MLQHARRTLPVSWPGLCVARRMPTRTHSYPPHPSKPPLPLPLPLPLQLPPALPADLEETFENLILDQLDVGQYGPSLLDPDFELDHVFD